MTARPALLLIAALLLGASGSPHGDPEACVACHVDGPAAPAPGSAGCVACHPTADMHPVGVVPQSTHVPPGWPLEAGAIGCVTCHAEAGCAPDRSSVAPWLRGGPVARTADFCVRCHDGDGLRRVDPHHPETPRDPADASCAACHVGRPAPGALPADARLRTEPDAICAECHGATPHRGAQGHVGAQQTRAVDPPLPLGPTGDVGCWTCHDVHGHAASTARRHPAAGEAVRALARAGRAPVEGDPQHPPLLALPAAGDALCRACHGDGG